MRLTRRAAVLAVAVSATSAVLVTAVTACATLRPSPPRCRPTSGLGLEAQAVPAASFVPCVASLPQGWRATSLDVHDGLARFDLASDRSPTPVSVTLTSGCDVAGATEAPPRAEGVRTLIRLRSVDPRYAGTLFDVFGGGCVRYTFDFQRGPHIALMEEFEAAVSLYPRRQLVSDLHRRLGIRLSP